MFQTVGHEVVIDLAAAENQALDGIGIGEGFGVGEDFLEAAAFEEIGALRNRFWPPEQALGGHEDEWFAEIPVLLAAERMEVLSGGGEIPDDHIFLRAELEEAFEAGAGMFRAHAFVAVRQKHDEVAGRLPFRLGGGDELVDDDLRAVGEVTELRFPQREHARVGERIAVVEAEHGELGEEGVVDTELRLLRVEVLQWDVARAVFVIVENSVAVGEGAAAAILTGKPDGSAFEQQGAEGQRLGHRPVDRAAVGEGLDAARDEALFQGRIEMEARGHGGEDFPDVLKPFLGDAGGDRGVRIVGLDDAGGTTEGGAVAGFLEFEHFLVAVLELVPDRLVERIDVGLGDDALGFELLAVGFSKGRASGDFLGDGRLGEGCLVGLVVALAAVAIHVDDDVAAEFLAEFQGKQGCPVEFHRLLAVDVEDRGLDHFCHVGGVGGRAGVGRHGGETDLVVDDQVDRSARAVTGELGEVEDLSDGALAGEGGVAVEEDRQDLAAVDLAASTVVEDALAGAGLALDDGVDGLEMARVGGQADADIAFGQFADALVAEVVFHVAVARDEGVLVGGREFVEDGGEGFPDKIGEHAHAAAVGHAHFDLPHAAGGAGLEDRVEHDHHALAAFVGEAFFAEEALAEEIFKSLGLHHPAQRVEFFLWSLVLVEGMRLDPLAHPVADGRVVDVHELEADFPRVGRLQGGHHVTQFHLVAVAEERVGDSAVEVGFVEAELVEAQPRIVLRLVFERIDVRLGVAERAVVVNQAGHPAVERGVAIHRRCGGGGCGSFLLALELGGAKFKAFEECRPRRLHRTRVLAPLRVFCFHQVCVLSRRNRRVHEK